ncbi:MAG: D-alanyl-D-alanine carboxypeptidase/D-alanyl-D-alanine-endopeptidase [Candidatus Scalindua sp. AMX11]|nr:MAG: D-alanyl-D-alanine carboxypeptidase/D-alanyl-D-alanine-endopeptidase [Candidatus Scalindua sp.]NOG85894.1 D-alanyl-D-alanine carboxypeptidase/D-alanyl-D-alanine-endopeptidase [Planctomycetota bacterium]RZV96935.1 MAG: D-alanyl-D-alanine carboxypeptidase/D-alanyl-D-alanine-endopeptidase [Candidatus Scalindua sp. SCAELEC01]TDE66452.1 MAG: D-alanyl-D-alanine carboxypeptidase/D-alanyl-D-alanine-endopeptidase [Candidatus Scalindua sp. AMX11]GJQ60205.1 MAG: peptidase M15 [Candidatus Scalindua
MKFHILYLKNKTLLIVVLFSYLLPLHSFIATAFAKEDISQIFQKQINRPKLKHAQWSFYAEYADTGENIVDFNGEKSLAPASGLKAITTGVALMLLGEGFRFETNLYYDGEISDTGILQGNLYLVGGGDPTLGSDQVKGSPGLEKLMQTWVVSVRKLKIHQITGSVIVDTSFFDQETVPDFWTWSDIGNYFGAGSSALCIHDNLYSLFFKPGSRVGDSAEIVRTEPKVEDIEFDNHMRTGKIGSGDNGYIYCAPKQRVATVRGTIPAGVKEFSIKGSIPDPPLFAAHYLTEWLYRSSVPVSGTATVTNRRRNYQDEKKICSIYSPPLTDIIKITNKKSINLYAEQLVKMVAHKGTGIGSTKRGIPIIENTLNSLGIDTGGFSLFDGSGLSRNTMVTTKICAKFLSAMAKQKAFDTFYNSLSVAGDPRDIGHVKKFGVGTPLAFNARVKTGYIKGVRSHSGYVRSRSGRLISFSLICNNFSSPTRTIDSIHQSVLVKLANLQ